jgi:hypothetical protein
MTLETAPDSLRIHEVAELLGYGKRFSHQSLHDLGIPHVHLRPHEPGKANGTRGVRIPKIAFIEWQRSLGRES